MILALLDLFKNVWKNAAIPICANDHPMDMIKNKGFDVLTKKEVPITNIPSR